MSPAFIADPSWTIWRPAVGTKRTKLRYPFHKTITVLLFRARLLKMGPFGRNGIVRHFRVGQYTCFQTHPPLASSVDAWITLEPRYYVNQQLLCTLKPLNRRARVADTTAIRGEALLRTFVSESRRRAQSIARAVKARENSTNVIARSSSLNTEIDAYLRTGARV